MASSWSRLPEPVSGSRGQPVGVLPYRARQPDAGDDQRREAGERRDEGDPEQHGRVAIGLGHRALVGRQRLDESLIDDGAHVAVDRVGLDDELGERERRIAGSLVWSDLLPRAGPAVVVPQPTLRDPGGDDLEGRVGLRCRGRVDPTVDQWLRRVGAEIAGVAADVGSTRSARRAWARRGPRPHMLSAALMHAPRRAAPSGSGRRMPAGPAVKQLM
jgi:hypothetical protein